MEQREFLSENKYQKTKKMLTMVAAVILLIGLGIGGALIATGVMKANERKMAEDAAVAKLQEEIDELAVELEENQVKLSDLEGQEVDMRDDNWFATQKRIADLKMVIAGQEAELKTKEFDLEHGMATIGVNGGQMGYYVGGGMVILFMGMIALIIFMTAKRREMLAFSAQQTMPVAQEVMTKMAPTIGAAAGEMAKHAAPAAKEAMTQMAPAMGEMAKNISKGWKEGQKEATESAPRDQEKQG